MKKYALHILVMLAACSTPAFSIQPPDRSWVVGNWQDAGGSRVVIDEALNVTLYNVCADSFCVIGPEPSEGFSRAVEDPRMRAILFTYTNSVGTTTITGTWSSKNRMVLERRTMFAKGTRNDTYLRATFNRKKSFKD